MSTGYIRIVFYERIEKMHTNEHGEITHFVRTPYNYDRNAASRATGLACTDGTRAQQQFRDECDINVILKRFGVTGQLPTTVRTPMTGDFTNITDYQSALNAVMEAQRNFLLVPSNIRQKFDNDPRKFVDFCIDPANIETVREMGLAPKPTVKKEPASDNATT